MTQPRVDAIRKLLFAAIRLLVTAGLLWALAAHIDLASAAAMLGRPALPPLLAGLAALFAIGLVNALRWHAILAAGAASPGRAALVKVLFVGLFFNQVLPTSIGGDMVRALRCRRLGIDLGPAIRSILLDRASGYAVFVLLYAAGLPTLWRVLPDPGQRALVAAVLAAAVLGALGLLFFERLPARVAGLPLLSQIAALSRESRRLVGDPRRATAVFGLSAVAVALNIAVFKLVGDSLGNPLPFLSWAVIVPPVTLIQLFPVALAGWGVRELGVVVALGGFGVPAEAALATSLLFGLCQFAAALPGGVIWLAGWDVAGARSRSLAASAGGRARRRQRLPDAAG